MDAKSSLTRQKWSEDTPKTISMQTNMRLIVDMGTLLESRDSKFDEDRQAAPGS